VIGNVTLEMTCEWSEKGASVLDLDMRYSNVEWGGLVKDCYQLTLTSFGATKERINQIKQLQVYDNIVLGSPCMLPFKDECFDLVFAMNAALPSDTKGTWAMINECRRVAIEKYYARSPYPSLAVIVGFVKTRKCRIISIS